MGLKNRSLGNFSFGHELCTDLGMLASISFALGCGLAQAAVGGNFGEVLALAAVSAAMNCF